MARGGTRGARGGRGDRGRGGQARLFLEGQVASASYDNRESEEVNQHLPERFRGRNRPGFQAPPMSISRTKNVVLKLNTSVRQYIKDAEQITELSTVDWTSQPELPTTSEILISGNEQIPLPANKVNGPYKNKGRYLRTHYNLLREDAVAPLRTAVEIFRENPDMMDDRVVSIYEKVHIAGFTFADFGVAARIKFSTTRAGKKIPWRFSKRLLAGTLVALTPAKDNFQSKCIVATVAARPFAGVEDMPCQIDIYFSNPEDMEIDPQKEFTMVEAKTGYYEAARHTLRALQKLSGESFPLAENICTLATDLAPPPYVSAKPVIDLKSALQATDQQYAAQRVDILHNWPTAPEELLDKTQWEAMNQILTKQLAIIQGPPGTGKTHVSKIALQVLIENRSAEDPPIVVAAQTNHALDQLLGHVAKFDPEYIRLGGRSKKPEVKKRALYEVRQNVKLPLVPGGMMGKARSQLKALSGKMSDILAPMNRDQARGPFSARVMQDLDVLSNVQAASIENGAQQWVVAGDLQSESAMESWLHNSLTRFEVTYKQDSFGFEEEEEDVEVEHMSEEQAEMGVTDEEDLEGLNGLWCSVDDNWTAARPNNSMIEKAETFLKTTTDMWKIKENIRGVVYSVMQAKAKAIMLQNFKDEAKVYQLLIRDLKIGKWERDETYLQRANIIGMTTTGLSKYRPLIASLKPKIILIEEAAEVIEAPVAAVCVDSLEHLILVGDHQQLQGHCNERELEGEPYNLNMSMFERLVHNDMPYKTLLRQRRMEPEFRRLLAPIYPQLKDHPDVVGRSCLPIGMGDCKSFFFDHDYSEYQDSQLSSLNDREAEFIAGFYQYLVSNSVLHSTITILTFYNGQRKRILSHLKSRSKVADLHAKVYTVDSYQGEENEFVILSLVRSNDRGKIGFLEVDNRVCVALSRARRGFYIFGNGKLLAQASPLWANVIAIMGNDPNRVGDKFPIVCKKHGRKTFITWPEEWNDVEAGGCLLPCGGELPCGHPCPAKCHPMGHEEMKCPERCNKTLVCGHQCVKQCSETCTCECDDFVSRVQASARDPSPDYDRNTDIRGPQAIPGNAWTDNQAQRGQKRSRGVYNGQVRGNNNFHCGDKASLKGSPQSTFGGGFDGPLATAAEDWPIRSSSTAQHGFHKSTDATYSHGSFLSSELQAQMQAGWSTFAGRGVRNDDLQRESQAEERAQRSKQAATALLDNIDYVGNGSPVRDEKVVDMANGRKKFTHQYQPHAQTPPGFGYATSPSPDGSGASYGENSSTEQLIDLD